jgi:hypothetical protein
MSPFGPAIWNVLHDAVVVGISQPDDDSLTLELDCDYLRDRFDDSGDRFILRLHGCDRFTYQPRGDESPITDVKQIAARRLWILHCEAAEAYLKVLCDEHSNASGGGELQVSAATFEFALDSGRPVSLSQITEVAQEYWQEWEATGQKSRAENG